MAVDSDPLFHFSFDDASGEWELSGCFGGTARLRFTMKKERQKREHAARGGMLQNGPTIRPAVVGGGNSLVDPSLWY